MIWIVLTQANGLLMDQSESIAIISNVIVISSFIFLLPSHILKLGFILVFLDKHLGESQCNLNQLGLVLRQILKSPARSIHITISCLFLQF